VDEHEGAEEPERVAPLAVLVGDESGDVPPNSRVMAISSKPVSERKKSPALVSLLM
jgi:hypothetical protein